MIGELIGGSGGGIIGGLLSPLTTWMQTDAARVEGRRNRKVQEAAIAAQKETADKSLSLEERMVSLQERNAVAASQPAESFDLAAWLPWLALGVGAWFLLRRR